MKPDLQRAFSLVEVVLAIGITAFALIAILGLLPVGLNTMRESVDEMVATGILTAVEADLRNVPEDESNSPLYGVPVWSAASTTEWQRFLDRNGHPVAERQEADYVMVCTLYPPEEDVSDCLRIHVKVAWPGRAAVPTGSVETLVAIAQRRL